MLTRNSIVWLLLQEPGKPAADVEFLDKPPGIYCVVVSKLLFVFFNLIYFLVSRAKDEMIARGPGRSVC